MYKDNFTYKHLPSKELQPEYLLELPQFQHPEMLNCVERLLDSHIENGNGDRKKYAEYVAFEEAKTQQLRVLLTDYVVEKEKTMTDFDSLYPEMNAFSLSLLNKKKNVTIKK